MSRVVTGSRLGPYEIVSKLGAGGMGEVWRATDTRLDRSVAVKVLPEGFANDAQLQLRFQREAKTISQLNHPHICTLHDIGNDDGVQYIVMELVEGESLADRLARGPLPLQEILRYGAQIADALDRAHRAGIVHRDIKPGNIMLTKSGAKLLDFGLAKGLSAPVIGNADGITLVRDPDSHSSATGHASQPLTAEGTIVGTFQYMAPEQLEGAESDARTDIFALGAVLYEMATGRRAFDGKTKTSLIAAIVGGQPPSIRSLQPLTPPVLEHVISRAMEKDPADRWQSARDIAEELRWIGEAGSQAGVPLITTTKRRQREAILAALAFALLIAASVLTILYLRASTRANRVLVSDLDPPPATQFNDVGDAGSPPVLSPDGRYVVLSATEGAGSRLYLREIRTGETRALSGTEDARFAFWSPDSRNIGFFGPTSLKRVDINGGSPMTLSTSAAGRGGAWSKEGVIVFSPTTLTPLVRIPETGGKPVPVTTMERAQHTTHRWPFFLPDGKHFLFLAANHRDPASGANGIYIGSIDGKEQRLVLHTSGNASYAAGQLLFVRDTTLYAQPMSADGRLSGDPRVVAEGVLNDRGIWRGGFSASDSDDLIYCSGQASLASRLLWVDRAGKEVGTLGDADMYWDVRLAPDDSKLAITLGDPSRKVWLLDLDRNTRTRLDFGTSWAGFPSWSPDGSAIFANVIGDQGITLMERRLDGSMPRQVGKDWTSTIGTLGTGSTISPDGKTIVFASSDALWSMAAAGGARPVRLTGASLTVTDPAFSPDGQWLAFVSNENGHADVFIALARELSRRWQVSEEGGTEPRWRSDGKELYYVDGHNRLAAVTVGANGESLVAGKSETLFPLRPRGLSRGYDVSRDGQRFIVNKMPDSIGVPVKMITNWSKFRRATAPE